MALIKSTGTASWGFELPTKGWHEVKVHETMEIKGTKKDDNKKMLTIPLCFDGGEQPIHTIYCLIDSAPGLRKIVDTVVAAGLQPVALRELKVDLNVGIEETLAKSNKFLNWVMAKMPGKGFEVKVEHGTYEAEDGTKKNQINLVDIRPSGAGTMESLPTSAGPKVEVKTEEGWD